MDATLTAGGRMQTYLLISYNCLKKTVPVKYTKLIKSICSIILIIQPVFPQNAFNLTAIKDTLMNNTQAQKTERETAKYTKLSCV
jgi:hypothetical protein